VGGNEFKVFCISGVSWPFHIEELPEVLSRDCDIVNYIITYVDGSYKILLHIEGCMLREQDRIHCDRCGRVDTLVTKEEAVRSFTFVRLSCEYVAEIHVHVKSESSALMRVHCYW
jgi:hypothetical protein